MEFKLVRKSLQIQSAQIVVSANPHSEVGWYSDIQIKAILPGCRKVRLLSSPTPFPGYLLPLPLFDHNGRADVLPEVFRAFLRTTCPAVQPYVPEVR